MSKSTQCEYCGRPIKGKPVSKVLRGKNHIFCSDFCFKLYFFDVPVISYADLEKMYSVRCVSVKAPDFRKIIGQED